MALKRIYKAVKEKKNPKTAENPPPETQTPNKTGRSDKSIDETSCKVAI